jgi:hypothetical protein
MDTETLERDRHDLAPPAFGMGQGCSRERLSAPETPAFLLSCKEKLLGLV